MMLKTEKLLKVFITRSDPFQFPFSTSKIRIDPLMKVKKEKAELALDLIDLISQKPTKIDMMKISLKERILEVIKTIPSLQVESRNYFESFFIDGINVDDNIFCQDRIFFGQNPKSNRFVFYPTYMVTGQIFNLLKNPPKGSHLLTGHMGIAKTTSVCLFYYLTKIIDEYRFLEGVELNEKMKNIPKMIYWSIRIADNKIKSIKNLILSQCLEIKNQKYIKDIDSFDDSIKIDECYKANYPWVKLVLIVDQINTFKKYQRLYSEALNKKPKELNKSEQMHVQNINQMLKSIQTILLHFKYIIHISSMNIENNIPQQVQLTLSDNQKLPKRIQIKYPSIIFQSMSMIELVNYFLFEVEQRILSIIKSKQFNDESIKLLRQKCLAYLMQKKPDFFISPLDIRNCITNLAKDQQWLKQFKRLISLKDKNSSIKQLFYEFKKQIDGTKDRYTNLLKNHFNKNDGNDKSRRSLMFQLYQECYLSKFQKTNPSRENQERIKKFKRYIDKININNLSWDKNKIFQFVDRRLFQMKTRQSDFLELLLPISFLQNFLEQSTSQHIDEYLHDIRSFLKGSYTPQQFRSLIQNLIILILKHGKTNVVLKLNNLIKQKKSYNVNFKFQKQTTFGFQALPKSQPQQYSLLSRLKDKIDQMIGMCKPNAVFFPLKKNYLGSQQQIQLQKINGISKMIDFIWIESNILEQSQINGFINVWVIDVTVKATEVQKKMLDFLQEFVKFSDRHQTSFKYENHDYSINVNYVIFGPKNVKIDNQAFIKKINSKSSNQSFRSLIFEQNTPTSSKMLKVKSLENKKCLLDYIGYIDMGGDLIFQKEDGQKKTILQFQTSMNSMEQLLIKRQEKDLIQKAQRKKKDL